VAKRKKKSKIGESFDFVVTLERPQTGTVVRFIEQFNPFNPTTGQLYDQTEFRNYLGPYIEKMEENYAGWYISVNLATNEEIKELSAPPYNAM
jgi:hypothetical protein